MTVGELKRMLDDYDEDMKIVFQPSGDMYGERMLKQNFHLSTQQTLVLKQMLRTIVSFLD